MSPASDLRLRRGFVHSRDGNIEYFEVGSGEPLLMLHSTPESCMALKDDALSLADEWRVIVMSTMGYGQSDRPPKPYTSMHEFAQAVLWLMDDLSLDRPNVYGFLTGSQIAIELASSWPERVDKLILDEVFNWGTESRRGVHERLHRYYPPKADGSHLAELWEKVGGTQPGADLRAMNQRLIHNLIVNDDDGCVDVYGQMGWEGAGPYAMCRSVAWDYTPTIKAPTLVIHTQDSDRGRAHEKFVETIPRSRGVRLATREDRAGWTKAVRAFLREPGV